MPKVICNCVGFHPTLLNDWSLKLELILNQSDTRLTLIATWTPAFSRALDSLLVSVWVLVGSFKNFPSLWLFVFITLVLFIYQSLECALFIGYILTMCYFDESYLWWNHVFQNLQTKIKKKKLPDKKKETLFRLTRSPRLTFLMRVSRDFILE